MINVRQGVFHLRNEEASYLFRVKDGFLEHLHFGRARRDCRARWPSPPAPLRLGRQHALPRGLQRRLPRYPAARVERLRPRRLPRKPAGAVDRRQSRLHRLPLSRLRGAEGAAALGAARLPRPDHPRRVPGRRGGEAPPDAPLRRPADGLYPAGDPRKLRQLRCAHPQMHERLHGASRRLGAAYLLRRAGSPRCSTPARPSPWQGSASRVRPAPPPAAPTPASCSPRRMRGSRRARSTASTCSTPGSHYLSAQKSLQGLTRVLQGISPANFDWELAPARALRRRRPSWRIPARASAACPPASTDM